MSTPPASLIGGAVQQHLPVTLADLARFCDKLIAEVRAIIDSRQPKSLLRMEEVERRVGLKKSSIHAKVSAGEFPAPVDLGGGRAIGFVSTEIDRWIEERIAASRRNGTAMLAARTPINAQRVRKKHKKRVAGTSQWRDGRTRITVPAEHGATP